MGVSIGLWHASIGQFQASYKSCYECKRKLSPHFFTFYASLMAYLVNIANQCLNLKYSFFGFYIMAFNNLILLCGVIEENPGPKTKPNNNLSVCHQNINNIPSNNFQKIAVLKSFVAMHKFDIICILETFLNNTYEDNDLNLNYYSLLQVDHLSNAQRGGVCIYHKETFAVKVISISYLNESLFSEVTIRSKRVLQELSTDLLAKILMNLSLLYQTSSFYFRIFPIATLT